MWIAAGDEAPRACPSAAVPGVDMEACVLPSRWDLLRTASAGVGWALLVLGSSPAACSRGGGGEPVEPVERGATVVEPAAMPIAVLSATMPQRRIALPRFSTPPTMLALTLGRIDNPQLQAFSVTAALEPEADGHAATIGTVAPRPASGGDAFALGLPALAQELVRAGDRGIMLRLSLEPIVPELPLVEPLEVTIATVAWQESVRMCQ